MKSERNESSKLRALLEGNILDSDLRRPVTINLSQRQVIQFLQHETNPQMIHQWAQVLVDHWSKD
jgi:hypothetical protein